jgi:hypothetical protein
MYPVQVPQPAFLARLACDTDIGLQWIWRRFRSCGAASSTHCGTALLTLRGPSSALACLAATFSFSWPRDAARDPVEEVSEEFFSLDIRELHMRAAYGSGGAEMVAFAAVSAGP